MTRLDAIIQSAGVGAARSNAKASMLDRLDSSPNIQSAGVGAARIGAARRTVILE